MTNKFSAVEDRCPTHGLTLYLAEVRRYALLRGFRGYDSGSRVECGLYRCAARECNYQVFAYNQTRWPEKLPLVYTATYDSAGMQTSISTHAVKRARGHKFLTVRVVSAAGISTRKVFHARPGLVFKDGDIEQLLDDVANEIELQYPGKDFRMVQVGPTAFNFIFVEA
jgi:hypothetical protein